MATSFIIRVRLPSPLSLILFPNKSDILNKQQLADECISVYGIQIDETDSLHICVLFKGQ